MATLLRRCCIGRQWSTLIARQVESAPFPEVAMSVDPQTHPSVAADTSSEPRDQVQTTRPYRAVLVALGVALSTALLAGLLGPSPASGMDENESAPAEDTAEVPVPDIMFPVAGPSAFTDTWGACRGSGCSRAHKGVDIFGVKLQPLVAAADGVITGVRRSALGISGNTIILESDDGWRYIYVHVNNDSPGTDDGANPQGWITANRLRVGDRVSAGDVIGYLGDSGNAENTPDHVHFEIHQPGVGAINPTGAVLAAREAGRVIGTAALASTAEGRAEHGPTVVAWYQALLKRDPTDAELFAWTDRFDIGFANKNDLIADLTMAPERRNVAGPIIRSFEVVLDRAPSLNEIRKWEEAIRGGTTVDSLNAVLLDSGAFADRHGELSDEAFINLLYRSGSGVDASEEELAGWVALFNEGAPRSELAVHWADSYAVKDRTWHDVEVIQAFRAALDRMPTPDEQASWVNHLNSGGLIQDVVETIRSGETNGPGDETAGTDEDDAAAEDSTADTASEESTTEESTTEEAATDETAVEGTDDVAAGDTAADDAAAGDAATEEPEAEDAAGEESAVEEDAATDEAAAEGASSLAGETASTETTGSALVAADDGGVDEDAGGADEAASAEAGMDAPAE